MLVVFLCHLNLWQKERFVVDSLEGLLHLKKKVGRFSTIYIVSSKIIRVD